MSVTLLKGNGQSTITSDGSSSIFDALRSSKEEADDNFQQPFSRGWKRRVYSDLREILRECSTKNWDGYDAEPVTPESFLLACHFLDYLPEGILAPEIAPDPDGYISFDWEKESLSFSVSAHEQLLVFAGIFGDTNKHHGEEKFINQIPAIISFFFTKYFRQLL